MTEYELFQALKTHYPPREYALLPQVANGTGANAIRHCDAVALSLWPSRGLSLTGFEIKSYRGDWTRELRNPEKAEEIATYCNYWYIVAAYDFVPDEEVPEGWGLFHWDLEKNLLVKKKTAPLRSPKSLDISFVAAMLRKAQEVVTPAAALAEAHAKGYAAGKKEAEDTGGWQAREYREIRQKVNEFQTASGISIESWRGAKEIGEAVKVVLEGTEATRREALVSAAKRVLEDLGVPLPVVTKARSQDQEADPLMPSKSQTPEKPSKRPIPALPASLEAEKVVLGSILLDFKTNWDKVYRSLTTDLFHYTPHRTIYKRMLDIHGRGLAIDRVTLANELMGTGEIEAVGGIGYLVSLDDGLPTFSNLDSYIAIIQEKAALREIAVIGQHLTNEALSEQETSDGILSRISRKVMQMQSKSATEIPLLTPEQVVDRFPGGYTAFLANSLKMGISTGLPQVDEFIMGLQPGSHYVIAGRTGAGKSALGANIATFVAGKGYPVAVFTLEMSKELWLSRAICGEAHVPIKAYVKSDLMPEQRQAIMRGAAKVLELPLYIDETGGLTVPMLHSRVGMAVQKFGIQAFVVDYVQILDFLSDQDMKFRNEYEAITYASRVCRMMAKQYGIVSIVLSQLTKPADKKKPGRPTLYEVKGAGGLVDDAVAVLIVDRPEMYQPSNVELRGKGEIIIAKSRMGTTGTAHVRFIGKYTTFVDDGPPDGPQVEDED